VTVRHLPPSRPDLAGQADGLGGVREGEPDGDGRGLEGAVLLAGMAPVVLAGGDRDVPPGQVLDLGVQARLVLLDHQDVMGPLAGDKELGVLALGVQGGGDDAPGQVQPGVGDGGSRRQVRWRKGRLLSRANTWQKSVDQP
jgi:hypothetical protein